MSPNEPTQTASRKGGMGQIVQEHSKYRLEKHNDQIYSEIVVQTFKKLMLKTFGDFMGPNLDPESPLYMDANSTDFRIPANVLNTDQLARMLMLLDDFGILYMGTTEDRSITSMQMHPLLKQEFENMDNGDAIFICTELISMFKQLREFLVVEYLNSMNNPVSESIVHNSAFYLQKEDDTYKIKIQLENWSGADKDYEGKQDVLPTPTNLNDLIVKVDKIPNTEDRNKIIFSLLNSMVPLAKSLDFVKQRSRKVYQSVNGQRVEKEVYKIPFQHFDIKPSNLFGRRLINHETGEHYYSIVLGDFGVSMIPVHPMSGYAVGTPLYIAPELRDGNISLDVTKTDIYSFAVTIYLLLTGMAPQLYIDPKTGAYGLMDPKRFLVFDEEKQMIVEANSNLYTGRDAEDLLIDRGVANSGNEDRILNVIARGMSIDPKYRYSSCEEFMRDLMEVINDGKANIVANP